MKNGWHILLEKEYTCDYWPSNDMIVYIENDCIIKHVNESCHKIQSAGFKVHVNTELSDYIKIEEDINDNSNINNLKRRYGIIKG